MEKEQCWEVKKCGRQPGAEKVDALGTCPAALPSEYDGLNGGKNAGRFCWAIAGTVCGGKLQGTYSKKIGSCLSCEVLKQVEEDEGSNFILTPQHAIARRDLRRRT
jgi:hypothetical protein